jgi:hypothetical protein
LQGPYSAVWKLAECVSMPLFASWPGFLSGSGKPGTPSARMQRAKAALKVPEYAPDR